MRKYNYRFLGLWMQHNSEFWEDLKMIERNLILQLVVNESPIDDIALEANIEPAKLRVIIEALFMRIERFFGRDISEAIRQAYNEAQNQKEFSNPFENFPKIYWN